MGLPTATDLQIIIGLCQEIIDEAAPLVTLLTYSDPDDDHSEILYAFKQLALKNGCLVCFNAQIDIAIFPISPFSVVVFGFDEPG